MATATCFVSQFLLILQKVIQEKQIKNLVNFYT